jgi:hypothetical protein
MMGVGQFGHWPLILVLQLTPAELRLVITAELHLVVTAEHFLVTAAELSLVVAAEFGPVMAAELGLVVAGGGSVADSHMSQQIWRQQVGRLQINVFAAEAHESWLTRFRQLSRRLPGENVRRGGVKGGREKLWQEKSRYWRLEAISLAVTEPLVKVRAGTETKN